MALIAARRPAFHLLAGDICYADPSGNGYPVKNNGAKTAADGLRQLRPHCLDPVLRGDREERGQRAVAVRHRQPRHGGALRRQRAPGGAAHGYAGHAARLDLPRTGPPAARRCTRFVYGNVGVSRWTPTTCPPRSPPTGLLRRRADRLAGPQLAHRPAADPRSTSSSCSSTTARTRRRAARLRRGVRAALAPLFDRFQVDLVVQGHNHVVRAHRPDPRRRLHDAGARRGERRAREERHDLHLLRIRWATPLRLAARRDRQPTAAHRGPRAPRRSRLRRGPPTGPRTRRPSTGPRPATSTTRSSP